MSWFLNHRASVVALFLTVLVAGCSEEADDDFRSSEHERLESLCAELDGLSQGATIEAERQRIDDMRSNYCTP